MLNYQRVTGGTVLQYHWENDVKQNFVVQVEALSLLNTAASRLAIACPGNVAPPLTYSCVPMKVPQSREGPTTCCWKLD